MSGDLMAGTRDASWWNHPDVTKVKVLHVAVVDGLCWTARCDPRIPLDENGGWRAADAPEGLRCRRPGCRVRWPQTA